MDVFILNILFHRTQINNTYYSSIGDSPEFHALGIFRVILNSFRKTFTMDELISANVYRSPVGRVTLLQIRHITKIYCNKVIYNIKFVLGKFNLKHSHGLK